MQSRASTTTGVMYLVAQLRRGRGLYQDSLPNSGEIENLARGIPATVTVSSVEVCSAQSAFSYPCHARWYISSASTNLP
jgi:hypothetical protein